MKKTKKEIDEQVNTASEKVHALVSVMLNEDVRPEVISTALAQELTCSIAAIASLKEDKTIEERFAFINRFFEMLAEIARQNCKDLQAVKEADHGYN